ncbi:hypothetical protein N3K66_006209 [Trichothecium roseum]|uniref:Uncharacterized protein n=1 Tax=Trichothecium roseum TaxID=47278 RepID=A0ACC0V1I1_9HYPO|nr:hypothetical protein N3K66_006209 [Trichothecium roseum]
MEGEELELQPLVRRTSSCGSASGSQTPSIREGLENCVFFYDGSEPIDSLLPAWNVGRSQDPAHLECDVESNIWQELNPGSLREIEFYRQRVTSEIEILPNPLHSRMNQGFRVMVDERIRFHLDTTGRKLLIKPLPRFLLDRRFWSEALFSDDDPDDNERECRERLFEIALGLLFSYAGLIRYESDFHIAMENRLLPQDMTWLTWRSFITGLDMECIYGKMHPWFCHDEMRHLVSRTFFGRLRKLPLGLSEILQGLGGMAIYATLVLAALQTGLSTELLGGNATFNKVSYSFVIVGLVYLAWFGVLLCFIVVCFMMGWVLYPTFDRPPVTKAHLWRPFRLTSVEVGQGATGSA